MGVENTSGNSSYQINAAAIEEMVLQTSGIGADTNADGPVVNIVPKGREQPVQRVAAGFLANDSMESENLTSDLLARGVTTSNKTLKMWDQSLSLGGPILQDRVWYFVAARSWGFSRRHDGVFWNQNTAPGGAVDGDEPVSDAARSRPQGRAVLPVDGPAGRPVQRAGSSGTTRT